MGNFQGLRVFVSSFLRASSSTFAPPRNSVHSFRFAMGWGHGSVFFGPSALSGLFVGALEVDLCPLSSSSSEALLELARALREAAEVNCPSSA